MDISLQSQTGELAALRTPELLTIDDCFIDPVARSAFKNYLFRLTHSVQARSATLMLACVVRVVTMVKVLIFSPSTSRCAKWRRYHRQSQELCHCPLQLHDKGDFHPGDTGHIRAADRQ